MGMSGTITTDGIGQGGSTGLTNAGTIVKVIPVFQRQGNAIEQCHLGSALTDDDWLQTFGFGMPEAQGFYARLLEVLIGRKQTLSSLVVGMVVGHSRMGDTCLAQSFCPLGFAPKDKQLVDGGHGFCQRTFQVDNHGICLTKYAIDTGKQGGYAFALSIGSDTTVKEHVTGDNYL